MKNKRTLFFILILIILIVVGVITTLSLLNKIDSLGEIVDDLETEIIMLNN